MFKIKTEYKNKNYMDMNVCASSEANKFDGINPQMAKISLVDSINCNKRYCMCN